MIVSPCQEGMIFTFRDKCAKNTDSIHNYLVIGTNTEQEKLGFIQCMSITSMMNKDVECEVPILMSNGMISYVVPYNIHSFANKDVELKCYKGCLTDCEISTKEEFIQLLLDIYFDSIHNNKENHNLIMERYNKYCSSFWKINKDSIEFRSYKEEKKEKKRDAPRVTSKGRKRKRKSSPNTLAEKPDKSRKRTEERDYRDALREYTGYGNSKDTYEEPIVYKKPLIPYSEELKPKEVSIEELKKLNSSPRNSKEFSDYEIKLFLIGYQKFSFSEFKSAVPDRWNSPSSLKNFFYSIKREAENRKINIIINECALMIDNMKENNYQKWTDRDIIKYLEIMQNHELDIPFLLRYTGLSSIHEVNEMTYKVKKIAVTRNLITV